MPHRLLLLNTDLEIGGTPTVIRELARRLHQPPEVHVEVAALSKWGPIGDQLKSSGIEVTPLNAKGVSDLWVIRRFIDVVRDHRIDTVFSFLVHANSIAAAAKPSCGGVRFFQSIQTTQAHPAWQWRIQRFVHYAAEKVIVPSPSVARVARERPRVPDDKLIIIPNAIDPADFPLIEPPTTTPFPIGFLGRFDPVKMVPDLIAAVADLKDTVHLHLFGDGPERESIERTVRIHHLEKHITLHGSVPRPQEALAQIGLLVLPSISEGMPMVLIEAMASGVPVLGRDVPGIRDVIDHDRTGILVKSLLVPDLTAAITRVIADAELRRRLISAARAEVLQRYTWDVVLESYREALGLNVARATSP